MKKETMNNIAEKLFAIGRFSRPTYAQFEKLVNERYPLIAALVSKETGIDVRGIPLTVLNDSHENGEGKSCSAQFKCKMSSSLLSMKAKYAGEDHIEVFYEGFKLINRSKRLWTCAIDHVLAHELIHAVDARREAEYMTNMFVFDFGGKEIYTDFRAAKVVEQLYPKGSCYRFLQFTSRKNAAAEEVFDKKGFFGNEEDVRHIGFGDAFERAISRSR